MAEINNSLALGVKPAEFDIIKPLMGAAQINSLRANTAQTEQETQYRQFQQDQGGGYRAGEANTLAETHQKQLSIAGQIGNAMVQAKTPEDRRQVIQMSHDAGRPVNPKTEQALMTMPIEQFHQHGQIMQQGGMGAATNVEQDPEQIAKRDYMRAAGGTAGGVGGDIPAVPSVPRGQPVQPMQERPQSAPIRTDENGRIVGNLATQATITPQAARINPMQQKGVTEAQNAERTANAQQYSNEYTGYKTAAANASSTKNSLRQIIDDSDRVYTGPMADRRGAAQRAIYGLTKMPVVGGLIEHFAGDLSDPVAALENIRKNVGIISRQAVGDIGERSNAALENVQQSIPTEVTSKKGILQATNQLMAIQDFSQARLIEATKWQKNHNGSLEGFAADWAKNMGPATFVMARLPKEEQIAVRKRMSATPEGRRSLDQIDKQIDWAKDHGLGSVID